MSGDQAYENAFDDETKHKRYGSMKVFQKV